MTDTEYDDIIKRANALRAFVTEHESLVSDDELIADPTLVSIVPAWNPGTEYEVDDRVRYEDLAYRVLQAHTAQPDWTPDKVPALFKHIELDPHVIPEWVQPTGAHDCYNRGDKARHNGAIWESLIDSNVWEPSAAVPTLWKQSDSEEER